MMSSSVESIESSPTSRSRMLPDDRAAVGAGRAREARSTISSPYRSSSSSVTPASSHFGLPACARSSSCASQSFTISRCAMSSASSSVVLGHLVGAGLDHRQAVLRADDDQVELAVLAAPPGASG